MTRKGAGLFATVARLDALDEEARAALFERGGDADSDIVDSVAGIVARVRDKGDRALRLLAKRYDDIEDLEIEVPASACRAALDALDPAVRDALEDAATAIAAFHRAQLPDPLELEVRPGVRLGRRPEPLARIGVYAPGGRAAYPSSVLMGVVPARIAGVGEVVVCSPPGPDGRPPAAVLAACAIGGADRVFAIGGAGAIAALAWGTETVPRVDKVVGPGNAYVTEAKRQLTGRIAIDCPAGPSEVLIVADATADAGVIAVELLAQAEHDPAAAVVLVTTDPASVDAVQSAVRPLIDAHPRRSIIESALSARGALLVASTLDEAVAFANAWAPEHLLLLVADPRRTFEDIRCAGTTFFGAASSVAFGDYMTGANHVLPTAGLARAWSGLSTSDFVRWSTWQELTSTAAAKLAAPTALLAQVEGLPGHAAAARLRARPGAGAGPDGVVEGRPAGEPPPVRMRPAYRPIRPYDPGRVPTPIDLSDNTNLFGPPPSGAAALGVLDSRIVTRYPSVYATDLKRALAERLGVGTENVTTGAGSDDVIDSAIRAFCAPGDTVAYPVPTFGVVNTFVRMNAAVPIEVPLGAEFALDASALIAAGATAIYLCRPNNPSGTAFDRADVERILQRSRGVVLIDEAYADFADDDVLSAVLASERGVVLRTMSKAYGLAGLRIGYAIGPPTLITEIEKSRGPYNVSGPAEAAALAALRGDVGWVARCVADVRENRSRLAAALVSRGYRVWPSAANFLLVQAPPALGGAAGLARGLRARGVQVRPFPALAIAGDAIRVSIGPWSMLERFLVALDAVATDGDPMTSSGDGSS